MLPTDLTVSAVVARNEKYLIVEERSSGVVVITQPGGHIEAGESPEDAVVRETMEESGCLISVSGLLGVYLWIHPQTRQQFLRIAYTA
ncbi:MAG TPA: NUDIX domain-containing protein, partial [Woeseiaceae bacterium]